MFVSAVFLATLVAARPGGQSKGRPTTPTTRGTVGKPLAAPRGRLVAARKDERDLDWLEKNKDDCPKYAHEDGCFEKNEDWRKVGAPLQKLMFADAPSDAGSCGSCGYGNVGDVDGPADCRTCPDGFELVPFHEDCTGVCADKELKAHLEAFGVLPKDPECDAFKECEPGGAKDEAATPKPSPRPREKKDCPWILEPLLDASLCPEELDIKNCAWDGWKIGDLCEADGECGTSKGHDICSNDIHDGADMYVIVGVAGGGDAPKDEKTPKPTPRPRDDEKDDAGEAETPRPSPRPREPTPRPREPTPRPREDKPKPDCPWIVEPLLDASLCPEELDIKNCAWDGWKVGDLCEADGECGTSKGHDICSNDIHDGADMYVIVGVREPSAETTPRPSPKPRDDEPEGEETPRPTPRPREPTPRPREDKPKPDCPWIVEPLLDASLCPEELDIKNCAWDGWKVGDLCEADGECGTSKKHDICSNDIHEGADMYVIVGVREPSAETPRPTPRPRDDKPEGDATPKPSPKPREPTPRPRDKPDCPWIVEPLLDESLCPEELDIKNCAWDGWSVGDLCEADGECGTSKKHDICSNDIHEGADMYVIVGVREPSADTPKPTPRPVREPEPEPPTDDTPKPTPEEDATPKPTPEEEPEEEEEEFLVDVSMRFFTEDLEAEVPDYEDNLNVAFALGNSLVNSGVAGGLSDVKGVSWDEPEAIEDEDRRRLEEYESTRAVVGVLTRAAGEDEAVALAAERMVRAAAGDGVPSLTESLEAFDPGLGDAFDAGATERRAAEETGPAGGSESEGEGGDDGDDEVNPNPPPTEAPGGGGGGSKKKKKEIIPGLAYADSIIILVILGLAVCGCCLLGGLAATTRRQEATKKKQLRAYDVPPEAPRQNSSVELPPGRGPNDGGAWPEQQYAPGNSYQSNVSGYDSAPERSASYNVRPENERSASYAEPYAFGSTKSPLTKLEEEAEYNGAAPMPSSRVEHKEDDHGMDMGSDSDGDTSAFA